MFHKFSTNFKYLAHFCSGMIATRTSLESTPDLPDYLVRHLHHAMTLSGYPIGLHEINSTPARYGVCIADKDHPLHLVEFPADGAQHLFHYLLTACEQIIRLWSVPPHRRVTPKVVRPWLPHAEHEELRRAYPNRSEPELAKLSGGWYRSTVLATTSVPMAIRIEEALYRHFPEHRGLQREFVQHSVLSLDEFVNPALAKQPPIKAGRAISSIATIHVNQLTELTGVEPGPSYKAHAQPEVVTPLLSIKKKNRLIGLYGDIWLTNAWAQHLGVRRWYEWTRLDP